jgi:hypothetical protein
VKDQNGSLGRLCFWERGWGKKEGKVK